MLIWAIEKYEEDIFRRFTVVYNTGQDCIRHSIQKFANGVQTRWNHIDSAVESKKDTQFRT